MTPVTGPESRFTLTSLPPQSSSDDGAVPVIVTERMDDETEISLTNLVRRCVTRVFGMDLAPNNFSPHLGETTTITVFLPGCPHYGNSDWLEIEVMRQTVGGWQHVAWVDMDPNTPGNDRYRDISGTGGYTIPFTWDGIAQTGLGLANHPDVFHGTRGSFNRAMPAIESGDPVPPPFYTVFARRLNANKEPVEESPQRVYIPQVVKVYWHSDIEALLRNPIHSVSNTYPAEVIYPGCLAPEAFAALETLASKIAAFFPPAVNIRFVHSTEVSGQFKKIMLISDPSQDENRRGITKGKNPRNQYAARTAFLYFSGFENSLRNNFEFLLNDTDAFEFPVTVEMLMGHAAASGAHEAGHELGLVDGAYLPEDAKYFYHNEDGRGLYLMDNGGLDRMYDRLNPDFNLHWKPANRQYLEFILPKQ
jgi:hypothetical protein